MEPLVRATLYLTTDDPLDLSAVTEGLGLPMAWGQVSGEPTGWPSGIVRSPAKHSVWSYGSADFERTFDAQAVLNRLLDELDLAGPALAAVRAEFGLAAHITLNIQIDDGHAPDGTLLASTLARLVALDIDLDLDLYTE